MFHAEMLPPIADSVGDAVQQSDPPLAPHGALSSYNTFLESRPPVFETCAIEEIVSLAPLAPQLHLHIVHLSATECIPILRQARQSGINITAETCFHYLGLASDHIEDGDTRHKCCPPIRSQTNQDGLWEELCAPDSIIKTIVSDHSPCTPELKLLPNHLQHTATVESVAELRTPEWPSMHHSDSGVDMTLPEDESATVVAKASVTAVGDFFAAWGGISSVGLASRFSSPRPRPATPASPSSTSSACAAKRRPSRSALRIVRGGLRSAWDADICVFDDEMVWTLSPREMRWKNRCSPWEGRAFTGRVSETWLRGNKVFQLGGANDGFVGGTPAGEAITERRTA